MFERVIFQIGAAGMRDLKNPVTGGSSGIGRAICRPFLDEEVWILAGDVNADALKGLAADLAADKSRLYPLAVDIAGYAAVKEAVDRAQAPRTA
jgi:NAD(P)-dependent dehydrogenase (short-subunit alcohol dehydrogenase family)